MMRNFFITVFLVACGHCVAQSGKANDSIATKKNEDKLNYRHLFVPAVLVGYGAFGLKNDQLLAINTQLREEMTEHSSRTIKADDFMQYAPALSVYAINAAGLKGRQGFKERTVTLATSYLITGGIVRGLKTLTRSQRPDGSSDNSFPSGHTATAFAGAEFLWQEFKDESVFIGIGGYGVATATGLFRIYNNRHWLTDVAAGAGIGILSVKFAYLISPLITDALFKNKEDNAVIEPYITPYYNGRDMGVRISLQF